MYQRSFGQIGLCYLNKLEAQKIVEEIHARLWDTISH